jgi:hypothetical protein
VSVAALIISVVALVVSIAGTFYMRLAARANQQSAIAESTTAALELDRRHAELTPQLRIRCRPANPGSDRLKMTVALEGPLELRGLDRLTVTIRDDRPGRSQQTRIAGGPAPEQVAAQIWGPFRFVPGTGPGAGPDGTSGADSAGRTTPTAGLPVGEELPFFLEPTQPPSWAKQTFEEWQRECGTVLRLTLECHKDGSEGWTMVGEIDTQTDNPIHLPGRGR